MTHEKPSGAAYVSHTFWIGTKSGNPLAFGAFTLSETTVFATMNVGFPRLEMTRGLPADQKTAHAITLHNVGVSPASSANCTLYAAFYAIFPTLIARDSFALRAKRQVLHTLERETATRTQRHVLQPNVALFTFWLFLCVFFLAIYTTDTQRHPIVVITVETILPFTRLARERNMQNRMATCCACRPLWQHFFQHTYLGRFGGIWCVPKD